MKHIFYLIILFSLVGLPDADLVAKEKSSKRGASPTQNASAERKPKAKAKKAKQTVEKDNEEVDPLEDTSTSFDFNETMLEGKYKAPAGMVLKGRVEQSKSQMVQLRKNFRPDLRKSSSAVRAIKPRE